MGRNLKWLPTSGQNLERTPLFGAANFKLGYLRAPWMDLHNFLFSEKIYSCTLQLVKHRAKMSPWWGIYRQSHDCTNEQSN